MKKLLFFFISVFLTLLTSFSVSAQESRDSSTGSTIDGVISAKCSDLYAISGPAQLKVNTAAEYSLSDINGKTVLPFGSFSLVTATGSESQKVEREKLVHSFSAPGTTKIILSLDKNVHQCDGELETEIQSFRHSIVYLGTEMPELKNASRSTLFREKSILFEPIFVGNNFKLEEQSSVVNSLSNADIMVFHLTDILGVFSDLEKINKIKDTSFSQKQIYIISPYQKTFLSKVLASTFANLGIVENVSLITTDQLNTLLNQWSYEDNHNTTL